MSNGKHISRRVVRNAALIIKPASGKVSRPGGPQGKKASQLAERNVGGYARSCLKSERRRRVEVRVEAVGAGSGAHSKS